MIGLAPQPKCAGDQPDRAAAFLSRCINDMPRGEFQAEARHVARCIVEARTA